MRDYLTLGPTPAGEDCEQVGPNFDSLRASQEMNAYIAQLYRQFPNAKNLVRIGKKSFPHDFGSYSEVCVSYDTDDEEQTNQAFEIENNLPESWDEQAIAELTNCGYMK